VNPQGGLCRPNLFDLDQRILPASGGDNGLGNQPPSIEAGVVSAFHRAIHFFARAEFRIPAKLIQHLEGSFQNLDVLHVSPPGEVF
jgi:hypothetical protein